MSTPLTTLIFRTINTAIRPHLLLWLPCIALSFACNQAPQSGDCEKLLTHRIEIEVGQSSASDIEKAEHKKRLQEEIGDMFIQRCNKDLKGEQVQCALKATTSDELESCDAS